MDKKVIVKIGGVVGAGKSTVAFIIEKALMDAGIPFQYDEDDLEMIERTPVFTIGTSEDLREDKVKDYGINVHLKTIQLNREAYENGVSSKVIETF